MTELIVKACAHCGKEFTTHKKNVVNCSNTCGTARNQEKAIREKRKIEKKCVVCGATFGARAHNQITCSRRCSRVNAMNAQGRGRFAILERDDFQCVYCGASPRQDGVKLAVDHIYPLASGGDNTVANLVTACERCNGEKNDKPLRPVMQAEILAIVERRNQERGIPPQVIIYGYVSQSQLAALIAGRAG